MSVLKSTRVKGRVPAILFLQQSWNVFVFSAINIRVGRRRATAVGENPSTSSNTARLFLVSLCLLPALVAGRCPLHGGHLIPHIILLSDKSRGHRYRQHHPSYIFFRQLAAHDGQEIGVWLLEITRRRQHYYCSTSETDKLLLIPGGTIIFSFEQVDPAMVQCARRMAFVLRQC